MLRDGLLDINVAQQTLNKQTNIVPTQSNEYV